MEFQTTDMKPIPSEDVTIENMVNRSHKLISSIQTALSFEAFKIFDTYLSLINPNDESTATVCLRKTTYEKLLGVDRIRTEKLRKYMDEISKMQYKVQSLDSDGVMYFNLFSIVGLQKEKETGNILLFMKCTDEAKSMLFNIETIGYIKYQLKNTLLLCNDYEANLYIYLSSNAFRRKWDVKFSELKQILHCDKYKNYNKYYDFNSKLLKTAIKHINEKTNLVVEYSYSYKKGNSADTGVISFTVIVCDNTIFVDDVTEHIEEKKVEYTNIERDIKEQIDYDNICNEDNQSYVDLAVAIITEIFLSKEENVLINKIEIPIKNIRDEYKKLNGEHIEYVVSSVKNTSKANEIQNIKSYMRACLYNAPATLPLKKETEQNKKSRRSYDIDELEKFNLLS